MLLDGIDCTVIRIVGDSFELDVEGVLTKHSNQYEVFEVVRDASFFAAVKDHLDALIADNETGIKLEELASFSDDDFATVGDLFDHVKESGLFRFETGRVFGVVDVFDLQGLFCDDRA